MDQQPIRVLLVDDELLTIELIGTALEHQGFEVWLAKSPSDAAAALQQRPFHAVVTDVFFDGSPQGEQVLAACQSLCPSAVVLLMTGYPALENAVAAIRKGAFDYLQKPVDPVVLATTIHRAVRERRIHSQHLEFQDLVNIMSEMVAFTIERVDPYTAGHGERTRRYCKAIAENFGLDRRTVERLELAAIAHDYGKIYLHDLNFLTKKGPLTASEYREVQKHPALGAEKLGTHPHLRDVCQYVAEHHEKFDGTGYPLRLKNDQVSPAGRILAIVEVFDSLSTKRSYKNPWSLQKTMDFFEAQSGRAFDPDILDVFLRLLDVHGEEWIRAPQRDLRAAGLVSDN
jgi:putative two-component system response regulator